MMAFHPPISWTLSRLVGRTANTTGEASSVDAVIAAAWLEDGDAQGLFGFVRRLGLTDEQADDAVQEVFTRLLAEHRRGVAIANPRAWTYRSIYRLAMDQHRLRARLVALVTNLGRRDAGVTPDDADRIAVWAAVDRLPRRQRQVVYLRYRSDLEYEEVGHVLGITSSAARSHATQAMATLRAVLAETSEERPHGR
jgi:RNA polymerase sigma factor (sigma-70 family)